ncbi:MAG: 23S rRNA (adenine(2503)-C(2))-methyltransferase RlmN [bacterium]|nr:23S rRNA (adenine(2503)-C(2))-methyltransferase RlmN [bacterium]
MGLLPYIGAMRKPNLLGQSEKQLQELMKSLGQNSFHGGQLFKWLYKIREEDFNMMTDLSLNLRKQLDSDYTVEQLKESQTAISTDGTIKYAFTLEDGLPIETVLIPVHDSEKAALCVSSQAGCALACKFCATGTMGLKRDLTVGEIIGQLMRVRDLKGENAFSNVVFMGMGEPLNNFDNMVETLKIITAHNGFNMAGRRVTVSTSGISPKIKKLADAGLKCRLAVSLHAATQEKREKIMPVAQTFKLDKLMEAIKYYGVQTGERVTLEYILFDGFNDSMEDVKALGALVRGIPCMINILAYNPVDGLDFNRPTDEKVDWFGRKLLPHVPAVTVRKSRGQDIDAACGQLAAKQILGR